MEGKYDWVLWSGKDRYQCVQIGGLFRTVPCGKPHANGIDRNNNLCQVRAAYIPEPKGGCKVGKKAQEMDSRGL